jgi:hypothetical protein
MDNQYQKSKVEKMEKTSPKKNTSKEVLYFPHV